MDGDSSAFVLYVGSPPNGQAIAAALDGREDVDVVQAADASEGKSVLGDRTVGCIVAEDTLPDWDGLGLLDAVRSGEVAGASPDVPFVLYATSGSERLASRAIRNGVTEYVPTDDTSHEDVATRVAALVEENRTDAESAGTDREDQQHRKLVAALSETFPDSVYVYSRDGEYLDAILGRRRKNINTREELLGQTVGDVFTEETADRFRETIGTALGTGELQLFEYALETAERTHWFEGAVAPIPDGYRGEPAVLLAARDITDRKERERELRETTQKLERQNERLSQFASVISHDLRNPLGIAETYVDFAEDTGDPDDFEAVREALDRVDALVEDLVTLARTDATVEEPQEIALADLAEQAWGSGQIVGATLETELPAQATVMGDPTLVRTVLENLFRNAIDHNDEYVTVTVGLLGDDDKHGFYVEDDGRGIPPGEREEIFEHGYTTSDDGTGFGLAIVEDVIRAHGWEIAVTEPRRSDGGARFEIVTAPVSDIG